ncbi:hypothetical protein EW146_g2336 [Bondarzewia mesenterica]|uniref:Initiator tRNA phosphoribosyl transferase n=1 Tax=Bondarzewia mesenterica TaxID=1095465 RepID=A0A4S4M0W0_9AGAM|nr:hypothetical protein EW146_g2336 [Bondarzewia mesenterica]
MNTHLSCIYEYSTSLHNENRPTGGGSTGLSHNITSMMPDQESVLTVQGRALAYLRKECLDLYNRLHSIEDDILFVNRVRETYPAQALLRTHASFSSWLSVPSIDINYNDEKKWGRCDSQLAMRGVVHGSQTFERRAGVFQVHRWTLRELELQPAEAEFASRARRDGAQRVSPSPSSTSHKSQSQSAEPITDRCFVRRLVLVDSTRAGKRMPDALSKSVPIWCAVINRAVLIQRRTRPPSRTAAHSNVLNPPWDVNLYTPPSVVSPQEHKQIEEKLERWAEELAASSYDLPNLPAPLRPLWISPATSTFPPLASSTSSSSSSSSGLPPFLPVISLVSGSQHSTVDIDNRTSLPTPIDKVSNRLLLCSLSDLPSIHFGAVLRDDGRTDGPAFLLLLPSTKLKDSMTQATRATLPDETSSTRLPQVLRLELPSGKRGQHQFLKAILPRAVPFVESHLQNGRNVCVACETGKDASVGVVLAMLQLFFNDDGKCLAGSDDARKATSQSHELIMTQTLDDGSDCFLFFFIVTKQSIRTRLQWIISSRPQANPSRTTLKRIGWAGTIIAIIIHF